jgi:hypothetical protein
VAEVLESAEKELSETVLVETVEVVGTEIAVGLAVSEQIPDHLERGVGDRDGGTFLAAVHGQAAYIAEG